MKAVTAPVPGGPEALQFVQVPEPSAGPGEVVLQIAATAVNRADLMQCQGHYPPPPGAPAWLGLEASGTVIEVGPDVTGWVVGDQACALLSGGGYAERVAVRAGHLLPIPEGVSLLAAAALPEVTCTVWSNVVMRAGLRPGQLLLVHGGSSGIGTMAIQLAGQVGARVAVTAGTTEKLARCTALGADLAINYRDQDFVAEVLAVTDGHGAEVILDNMGAKYLARNVEVLAPDGQLVVIGLQGGRRAELDLGTLLSKRAAVHATSLRGRPDDQKSEIVAEVIEHVWPLIADGAVHPVIDRVLPWRDVAEAHRVVERSEHIGKVLLALDDPR